MAAKKKKSKRRSGRRYRWALLMVFAIPAASGLVYALLANPFRSTSQKSPPAYEETFSTSSSLQRTIAKIDHTIYETLFRGGIRDKDIRFLRVSPRNRRGYHWDFAEILVSLPGEPAIEALDGLLHSAMQRLPTGVRFEREKGGRDGKTWLVFAEGMHTHTLRLLEKRKRETAHSAKSPRVAIIIDDLGYERDLGLAFAESGLPLDLSLLPGAPHREIIVRAASSNGRELMLHLPMEPKNYPEIDPGPGALFVDMGEGEIRQILTEHLDGMPDVRGVNNHMGSQFTERRDKVRIVLDVLRRRGLFFVDSRTTPRTVASEGAREMGVPVTERSVFLDNDLSEGSIELQLARLLGIAQQSGGAVGIGHPHRVTLTVLKERLGKVGRGFEIVPASKLVQ
jgi:polysaccharide deacetylase 2 family uncharacterized protein YibQ